MERITLLKLVNKKIADKLCEATSLMEERSKHFHEVKKIDNEYRDICTRIDKCWGYIDALEELERML